MLLQRSVTGILGAIVIIALIFSGAGYVGAALLVLSVFAVLEYSRILSHLKINIRIWPILLCIISLIGVAFNGLPDLFLAFCLLLPPIIFFLFLCWERQRSIPVFVYSIIGIFYIGGGLGSIMLLRQASVFLPYNVANMDTGAFFLTFAVLGTWASDVFAYFIGRNFGKNPLAKTVSPNKTLEGFVGGLVGTLCVTGIFAFVCGFNFLYAMILGFAISIFAPVGDLFESLLKRFAEIKDTGNVLPGHGGVLDRFDSLLFVAPLMLAIIIIIIR